MGATETGNDSAYLKELFASINLNKQLYIHHHRIPHPISSSKTRINQPRPLSLTYLTHKAKHTVKRSLHHLSQSKFPVSFCDPLSTSQQQARSKCVSTIKKLNSDHPLPYHRYAIRGTTNFHVAIIPKDPPILII